MCIRDRFWDQLLVGTEKWIVYMVGAAVAVWLLRRFDRAQRVTVPIRTAIGRKKG